MKIRQYATYVAPDGIIRKTELMEADGKKYVIDKGVIIPLAKLRFYMIDDEQTEVVPKCLTASR